MIELKEYKGKKLASAKELHRLLGMNQQFSQWVKYNINKTLIEIEKDFYPILTKSTGGRPTTDYLLTRDSALGFIMVSGGKYAKSVRTEVLETFKQKQIGILLNVDQVSALTDMVKAMTLVSNQKDSERKHYNFLNRPKDWYNYRAELLGYSASSLREAMVQVNKKYKSQKQALIHLDPSEIIRTGVVDLLIALGRGREYALNIAEFAKVIAEKNGYHLQIWNDTKPNPLGINNEQTKERKKLL